MQTRRTIVVAAALLAAAAFAQDKPAATQPAKDAASPPKAVVGQDAPAFTLLDSAGKKHSLADLKDKTVVLEWVNQQCPWSVKSLPVAKELARKYADKGVVWLAIDSTWGRKPEENEKYIKDQTLPYPILMDTDGAVGRQYGATNTPHLFVIARGKLVYAGALHNDQEGRKPKAEVRQYVDEALGAVTAGKPVPLAETKAWGCNVKYKGGK